LPGHRAGAPGAADPDRGDAIALSRDGDRRHAEVRRVAVRQPAEDAARAAAALRRRANGRGGIRTPEAGVTRLLVFKTSAFNRSATLPRVCRCYALVRPWPATRAPRSPRRNVPLGASPD